MSRFDEETLDQFRKSLVIGIRAGKHHRFIGIWAVVVENRVFVRSWSRKERSWYTTFRENRAGAMTVGDRQFAIRAAFTRSERLKDEVSRAYRKKYSTPGSLKYALDLARKKSRETTTELVPV